MRLFVCRQTSAEGFQDHEASDLAKIRCLICEGLLSWRTPSLRTIAIASLHRHFLSERFIALQNIFNRRFTL